MGESATLDRSSPLPLWAQLEQRLTRRVAAGDFADGFPAELELQREYGVSRQTVREALRKLRADGVVLAERGRRSRIAKAPDIEQSLGTLYSLFRSVEATGHTQRSIVRVADERRDESVTGRLGLEPATPLVHLERLRLVDDEPLALDRVWMPAALARPLLGADFTRTALYDELDRRCGVRVHGGHERILAVVPTPAQRRVMRIDAGTGAFAIERLGYWHEQAVEWRETLVRGDRFFLSAAWSPFQDLTLAVATAIEEPLA
ncbi:MAG TPA: GntR family transcriptional regulator [Acidimicrobiales bacterium]|nr:GntR family transcriptional regulator [Acidimicrobiales bacterium]